MSTRDILVPENLHYIDYSITMDDVKYALERGETLTARVVHLNAHNYNIIVAITDKIFAKLPWEEATIYPLSKSHASQKVPNQIIAIKGKKIRVRVTKIATDGTIYVSRRAVMQDSWHDIVFAPLNYAFTAQITGFDSTDSGIFYDIGGGVIAFCHILEFSTTIVDLPEFCKAGDIHKVSLLGLSDIPKMKLSCSRKLAEPKKRYSDYHRFQMVKVKISSPIYDCNNNYINGYRVEVNPLVHGILDVVQGEEYKCGTEVWACIKKIKPQVDKMTLEVPKTK